MSSRTNLRQSIAVYSYSSGPLTTSSFVWTPDKDSGRVQGLCHPLYANTDRQDEPCDWICKLGRDRRSVDKIAGGLQEECKAKVDVCGRPVYLVVFCRADNLIM